MVNFEPRLTYAMSQLALAPLASAGIHAMANVEPRRSAYMMNHPPLAPLASQMDDNPAVGIQSGDAINDEHIFAARRQHDYRKHLRGLNRATELEVLASKKRLVAITMDSVLASKNVEPRRIYTMNHPALVPLATINLSILLLCNYTFLINDDPLWHTKLPMNHPCIYSIDVMSNYYYGVELKYGYKYRID